MNITQPSATGNPPGVPPHVVLAGQTYNGHRLTLIQVDGRAHVLAREVGQVLGYARGGDAFIASLAEWAPDLREGDHVVKLEGDALAGVKEQLRTEMVRSRTRHLILLTDRGLLRSLMLAGGPVAVRFRDWAEEVLLQVSTTAAYPAVPTARVPSLLARTYPVPARRLPPRWDEDVEALKAATYLLREKLWKQPIGLQDKLRKGMASKKKKEAVERLNRMVARMELIVEEFEVWEVAERLHASPGVAEAFEVLPEDVRSGPIHVLEKVLEHQVKRRSTAPTTFAYRHPDELIPFIRDARDHGAEEREAAEVVRTLETLPAAGSRIPSREELAAEGDDWEEETGDCDGGAEGFTFWIVVGCDGEVTIGASVADVQERAAADIRRSYESTVNDPRENDAPPWEEWLRTERAALTAPAEVRCADEASALATWKGLSRGEEEETMATWAAVLAVGTVP